MCESVCEREGEYRKRTRAEGGARAEMLGSFCVRGMEGGGRGVALRGGRGDEVGRREKPRRSEKTGEEGRKGGRVNDGGVLSKGWSGCLF